MPAVGRGGTRHHDPLPSTLRAPSPHLTTVWSHPPLRESTVCAAESGRKRGREPTSSAEEIEASASPILKKGRDNMKRTPQAALTQSWLTGSGMLQLQKTGQPMAPGLQHQTSEPQSNVGKTRKSTTTEPVNPSEMMETGPPDGAHLAQTIDQGGAPSTLVATDFLLKSLLLNTEQIIKSFTSNLGALALKIDSNTMKINDNSQMIKRQAEVGDANREEIVKLNAKVTALKTGVYPPSRVPSRAVLSPEYMKARRAIRMWKCRRLPT